MEYSRYLGPSSKKRKTFYLLTIFAILIFILTSSRLYNVDHQVDYSQKDYHPRSHVQAIHNVDHQDDYTQKDYHPRPHVKTVHNVDHQVDYSQKDYHPRPHFQAVQACILPQLDINHSSVIHFFHEQKQLECSKDMNWVYVENGTFRITQESQKRHGKVICEYVPLFRNTDFNTSDGKPIKPMLDGAQLESDFFKVNCSSEDQQVYSNVHSGISYNATTHARGAEVPLPDSAMGLSVFMLGFDSLSRMTWMRKLPETQFYLKNTLKAVVLEGFNNIADGTPEALLPILTGHTEEELPEARRGFHNASTVDEHPWIWKQFKKLGYITQWAEDETQVGTFTYRMLGFKDPPVDHYMRPFYLRSEKMYSQLKPFCLGSMPRLVNLLNWFKDSFLMYGKKRKFMLSFHSEYSHHDSNRIQWADSDVKNFLQFLENGGYLDQTILIMMSDHGARFQEIRETVQGKLEQRMPYFAFRFPPWFETKYPLAMKNFRTNAYRLTTPFDVHETFKDILNYKAIRKGDISKRGISLFREIPKERSCAHAGILPHWCACLTWDTINIDDVKGLTAVKETIKAINSYTEPHRDLCANVTLYNITRMVKFSTNDNAMRDKPSKYEVRRDAVLSGKTSLQTLYQVTFRTNPGNGHFEATVRYSALTSLYIVDKHAISRINRYGNDPACIMAAFPHLRPYCYCKKQ